MHDRIFGCLSSLAFIIFYFYLFWTRRGDEVWQLKKCNVPEEKGKEKCCRECPSSFVKVLLIDLCNMELCCTNEEHDCIYDKIVDNLNWYCFVKDHITIHFSTNTKLLLLPKLWACFSRKWLHIMQWIRKWGYFSLENCNNSNVCLS